MHYKSLLPHVVLSAIAMILTTNVAKAQTDYSHYYVNTPEPTGLPGAFVIDEKEAKGK